MGYERMYGPKSPCACGKGTEQPYRIEHDFYPSKSRDFGAGLEIDCSTCDPDQQSTVEDRWERTRPAKKPT